MILVLTLILFESIISQTKTKCEDLIKINFSEIEVKNLIEKQFDTIKTDPE